MTEFRVKLTGINLPFPEERVLTGLPLLDRLLGGGIMFGSVAVVLGERRSGKTSLLRSIFYYNTALTTEYQLGGHHDHLTIWRNENNRRHGGAFTSDCGGKPDINEWVLYAGKTRNVHICSMLATPPFIVKDMIAQYYLAIKDRYIHILKSPNSKNVCIPIEFYQKHGNVHMREKTNA